MKKILLFCCCLTSLNADLRIDTLKNNVSTILPSIEGWCSKAKANSFIDLVLEEKPDLCVEIGVFGGSSLFPVASALKHLGKGTILGIDPWNKVECIKYFDPIEDAEHLKWWGELNIDVIYQSFNQVLEKYNLKDVVKIIRATSEVAANLVNSSIDILYIDGNHSEACSTQDVQLYLPKVRSGGYIWMNDTLSNEKQEAIDLLLKACDVIRLIDSGNCILFKKR